MTMILSELIAACIALKKGDTSFILTNEAYPEGWRAEIGNPVASVRLGESDGEFDAWGETPENAVFNLLETLRETDGVAPDLRTEEQKRIAAMTDEELHAYNAELRANPHPSGITHQIMRASWIATETIAAPSLRISDIDPA